MRSAVTPSSMVFGSRSAIASTTGCLVRSERPRSPCTACWSQTTYWSGSGWSSPYSCRSASSVAGSRSSPAKTRIGSPGESRISVKMVTVRRNGTGIMSRRRRRMYWVTPPPYFLARLFLQPAVLEADDLVRVWLEALELCDREELGHAEAIPDAGRVVHGVDLLRGLQCGLALLQVGCRTLLVKEPVNVLVRVCGVVERTAAVDVVVGVPIGIDAAAPADVGEPLESVVALQLENLGELKLNDVHLDVGFKQLGLHELCTLQQECVARGNEDFELERARAHLLHQLLRALRVGFLEWFEIRIEGEVQRRDRAVRHSANPEIDLVENFLAVDRHRNGLHVAAFVENKALLLIGNQASERKSGLLLVDNRRVRLESGDVRGGDGVGYVGVSRLHVRRAHRAVGDRLDRDLVQVRQRVAILVLPPPARVLLESDVVALDRLGEHEGTGPRLEGLAGEVVRRGCGLEGLPRHHHSRTVHEVREERRERSLEIELDGVRVDDGERVDRCELTTSRRACGLDVTLDVPFDGLGVEDRAVVELHVLPQAERDALPVWRDIPLLRQPGDDLSARVDADDRVVYLVMHISIDEGARTKRIKVNRIVLEREHDGTAGRRLHGRRRRGASTASGLLTSGACGKQDRERGEECEQIAGRTHRYPPPEPTGFHGGYVRPLSLVQRPFDLEPGVAALLDPLAALPSGCRNERWTPDHGFPLLGAGTDRAGADDAARDRAGLAGDVGTRRVDLRGRRGQNSTQPTAADRAQEAEEPREGRPVAG